MGTFSLATDFGMGLPPERSLRAAALAVRLGEAAGIPDRDRADAFYLAFLRHAGCTADSALAAGVFGDEVEVRGALYGVDWGSPSSLLPALARAVTKRKKPLAAAALTRTMTGMPKLFETGTSHCEVGDRLAEQIGFDARFRAALAHTFERWDGKGWPKKLRRDAIAASMRIAQVADEIESAHRSAGVEGARAILRRRANRALDPELTNVFDSNATSICSVLEEPSPWTTAMGAEPGAPRTLDEDQVDAVLEAMGHFADLKSRYRVMHSTNVAELARRAAQHLRLGAEEERTVARAGLVHDLGIVAISARVWDKPSPLTDLERETVRMHAYVGERILSRAPCLARVAEIATRAHERLDGRGYHRGLHADGCSAAARVLAAADVYTALIAERPHRPAKSPDAAASELSSLARDGSLCPDAVAAVLASVGHAPAAVPRKVGLSDRELDVLKLVARGLTNKEIAVRLGISTRTAGHHLEHIYEKIGVTTRAAATMFAMQNRLLS